MANRARVHNKMNHSRQLDYLRKRVIMLPKVKDEKKGKK